MAKQQLLAVSTTKGRRCSQGDKQGRARFSDKDTAKAALEKDSGMATISGQTATLRLLEGMCLPNRFCVCRCFERIW